jgi:hypothetical protein
MGRRSKMEVNDRTQPEPTDAARGEVRRWRMLALAAGAYLLPWLLGEGAGRLAAWSWHLAAAVRVVAFVGFIAIWVAMVGLIVRLPLSWRVQLALAAVFAAATTGAKIGEKLLAGNLVMTLLGAFFLAIAATLCGALISRIIRERNLLVPVTVVAAVVDTLGVYWGPVRWISEKAPEVAEQLSAAVPGAAGPGAPEWLLAAVGIGDFLFMGLFVAAVYRLGMDGRRTLWASFAALLAVPVTFAVAGLPALPGLPFLGAAVLVANWRHFRFSRSEKFALLYGGMAVAVAVCLALGVRHVLR